MKNLKKVVAVVVSVCVIGAAGMAYAADIKTPAELAAALTGKGIADVNKERATGKTYGTIAKDAGKLEEFQGQMLEQRKAVLDQRVKNGEITQQQADDIYNVIKNNQANCDGTGNAQLGKQYGLGCGNNQGQGQGKCQSQGKCQGQGQRQSAGRGQGSNGVLQD